MCKFYTSALVGIIIELFAPSQEIPPISRNPKVHYRTHKRPPLVPILGQANPVHIPTSHLLEIHPNIIHPPTPRSPQWSLSLRFPHQDPIHALAVILNNFNIKLKFSTLSLVKSSHKISHLFLKYLANIHEFNIHVPIRPYEMIKHL